MDFTNTERNCLMINDEALIEKLEYFLYDYSGVDYDFMYTISNYLIGNEADDERISSNDNIYELREMLSYYSTDAKLDEKTLNKAIDLFLLFLRNYSIEATMALNGLLDTVRKSGKEGHEWNCVRRLTGILAAVYLLYFAHKAKMFNVDGTEIFMKEIFRENINFYTIEDKRFLNQIFMAEKQDNWLILLLQSNLQGWDIERKYTVDSERIIAEEYFKILNRFKDDERYDDAILFLDESKHLLKLVTDSNIRRRLKEERRKAAFLFNLGKYKKARTVLDKYIGSFGEANSIYDLYNSAIYYSWMADFKEKNDASWKKYIERAFKLINQAEDYFSKSNDLPEVEDETILYRLLLEKSFLLSEKGDYDRAFECFKQAFSKAHRESKKVSNFSTRLWILMKYMCLHPEEYETVIGWIECFCDSFSHKELKEYGVILDFVHSNEYLKNNSRICTEIYKSLLQLLFHALEIRHETKIRDVSKYDILYYTKADHLRLLFEDETVENCNYRLPMFHVNHMNDPQEGRILRGLLKNDEFASVDTDESPDSENQYEENYVFLKSFIYSRKSSKGNSMKEFLPMWVQYGNDAQGCCVVLNSKTFENSTLHRIVYLTDDGKCDKQDERDRNVGTFLDEFLSTYRELVSFCNNKIDLKSEDGKECLSGIKSLVKYITSQISYLFKNQLYRHENEARLIVSRTSDDLADVKVIPGSVPKMYIYNDSQTYIDEVILGAKIVNPEDYVPFIYKQGRKMWGDDKQSQIKVSHSTIQYR